MFLLKACPRCSGDLYTAVEDDLTCLQCGKEIGPDLRKQLLAARRRPEAEKVRRLAPISR